MVGNQTVYVGLQNLKLISEVFINTVKNTVNTIFTWCMVRKFKPWCLSSFRAMAIGRLDNVYNSSTDFC